MAKKSTILGFINRKQWAEAKRNWKEQNNGNARGCGEGFLERPEEFEELY